MSSSSTSNSGGGFEETKFMKDLINLRDTQEAIQSFSAWCIKHRKAAYKIARCWLKIVKKVRVDQKLTLFYLLNDIVQHCRRKNYSEFLSKFESVLKEAMPHLRDDKINVKLLRCINIWSERNVFSENFLEDIKAIIIDDKETEEIDNFQPTQLCTQIKIMKALEDDTDYKLKTLKDSEINIMDIDSLRQTLKDRQDGNDFISDFEKSTAKMQDYIKAIDKELGKRRKVIELLTNGGKYYESLLGEANIVANAYTNFEKRLLNLKRKLGEKIPELEQNPPPPVTDSLSPIPSPDYDAPSPVNDEYELKLPGEDTYYDPASSHSTLSTVDNIDGAKSTKTVGGKSSNSPANGSRDLNQRLNSIMSSSENNCSSVNSVPSNSNTDKNFSISEFLTRLAEGKPVGKYNNPPSINGAGYNPSSSEKNPLPVEPPSVQNQAIQQQTLSPQSLSVAQPVPMPVQYPHVLPVQPPQPMPVPPQSLSVQPQQTMTIQPPPTHSIPSHVPPLHSDQSSVSSDWWNAPPPPPPPLPVPAQLDSQSESWPEPWEEPVPEWKLQPEDEIVESEKDLIRPYNNREPILSTSCSYPLNQPSSENKKNNLISLVSGSTSAEVDMDVVDSDHDDHHDQSGSGSQSLSLQDRLRNLAGIPVTISTPEKNDFKPPPFTSHQGPHSGPSWESSKKIRSNHFNNFHRGNRGSPYRGRGGRGFNASFDRDYGSFDRSRGSHRGFRGGRW